jgi:peptidoglycan/LPS O-acetylase OafA/YrhL
MLMTSTGPDVQLSTYSRQRSRLLLPGLAAAAVAAVAVTAVAALAMAVGVDFELPDGGESIPLAAFTQLTFAFSVVGILLALAIRRRASRPARIWVRTAAALTALSLVPPFLVGADLATECTLVLAHLVAAAIVIPVIARRLAA